MNTILGADDAPSEGPIVVGLGANLVSPRHGTPRDTLAAALAAFPAQEIYIERCSRWYRSAPVPASDQPWFVNAVAVVCCRLTPRELLDALHRLERGFGRQRHARWEARTIDLDLIAFGGRVTKLADTGLGLVLPHPRAHERSFVLLPLREIEPNWRHPRSGLHIDHLCRNLPDEQIAIPDAGQVGPAT